MKKIFDKKNIILLKINEADLNSFLIDTDLNDDGVHRYMLEEFAKELINVVPEYVFAQYEDTEINSINAVEKIGEAARSIYKIKEFDLMRKYYLENDLEAKKALDRTGMMCYNNIRCLQHHEILAQLAEHTPFKRRVEGSNPSYLTKKSVSWFVIRIFCCMRQSHKNPPVGFL